MIESHPIADRESWLDMLPLSASDLARFEEKFMPEPNTGCWLWIGALVPDGYGSFRLSTHISIKAHRLSWLTYCGPIPGDAQVLHRCDVRSCVNPDHLFLGDNDANVADRVAKGRSARNWGRKSPTAKLTEEQAAAILRDPRTHAEIAADYGISTGPVQAIKAGKGWRHVLSGSDRRGHLTGEACPWALLTEADVRAIRGSSLSERILGIKYGVSSALIGRIKRRMVWKHVD